VHRLRPLAQIAGPTLVICNLDTFYGKGKVWYQLGAAPCVCRWAIFLDLGSPISGWLFYGRPDLQTRQRRGHPWLIICAKGRRG